jgi:hypothetical protein
MDRSNAKTPATNDHIQCPVCHSLRTRVTKGEFKASGFQAFDNRICDQCGTAWRPRCPRWAAIVSIVGGCVVVGSVLAIVGFLFNRYGPHIFSNVKSFKLLVIFGLFAGMGLWACSYGVDVLRRRAGRVKILGKVIEAPAAPETSEPGSSSLTDGVCVGCQRPIPPGSAYCPHCGRSQPS